MSDPRPVLKMYSDFKSPYAFLAFSPFFDLGEKYDITLRWLPFQLRLKGKGQRSIYSEFKIKYSYMDARRWSNKRGGLMLRGPLKIYDTEPALIGGLFADRAGRLHDYGVEIFDKFFKRELEIDEAEAVAGVIAAMGLDAEAYHTFLAGEGKDEYERIQKDSLDDQVFGVPLFIFEGEQFWGYDRMGLLEETLADAGLAKG